MFGPLSPGPTEPLAAISAAWPPDTSRGRACVRTDEIIKREADHQKWSRPFTCACWQAEKLARNHGWFFDLSSIQKIWSV